MRSGPYAALGSDPAKIAGVVVPRGTLRRVLRLAKPYRARIAGFLTTIVLGALLALVPPLLFRQIIDDVLPTKDRSGLNVLAALVVVVALFLAALSFLVR